RSSAPPCTAPPCSRWTRSPRTSGAPPPRPGRRSNRSRAGGTTTPSGRPASPSCTPRSSADVLQVDDDVGIGAQLLEERDHGLVAVLLAQLLLDLRLHLLQRRDLAGTAPLGPLGLEIGRAHV